MLILKYGVDWELEEEADEMLAEYRRGIGSAHSLRRDFYSKSQLKLREAKEINPRSGSPEKGIIQGQYTRRYNPNARSHRRIYSDSIEYLSDISHEPVWVYNPGGPNRA